MYLKMHFLLDIISTNEEVIHLASDLGSVMSLPLAIRPFQALVTPFTTMYQIPFGWSVLRELCSTCV